MSLPHWIKWNNVIGEYVINNNMDCFEQKNRYELSLISSFKDKKRNNIKLIQKMINDLDDMKNYEVKDIDIQTSKITKNRIVKIQKSLKELQNYYNNEN